MAAIDQRFDIAVLKTSSPTTGITALRVNTEPVPAANALLVLGRWSANKRPLAWREVVPSQSYYLGKHERLNLDGFGELITLPLDLPRGFSGSPVLSSSRGVLGMVAMARPATSASRGKTVLIPASRITNILKRSMQQEVRPLHTIELNERPIKHALRIAQLHVANGDLFAAERILSSAANLPSKSVYDAFDKPYVHLGLAHVWQALGHHGAANVAANDAIHLSTQRSSL